MQSHPSEGLSSGKKEEKHNPKNHRWGSSIAVHKPVGRIERPLSETNTKKKAMVEKEAPTCKSRMIGS